MTSRLSKNFHGVGIGPLSKKLAVKRILGFQFFSLYSSLLIVFSGQKRCFSLLRLTAIGQSRFGISRHFKQNFLSQNVTLSEHWAHCIFFPNMFHSQIICLFVWTRVILFQSIYTQYLCTIHTQIIFQHRSLLGFQNPSFLGFQNPSFLGFQILLSLDGIQIAA